ncbi:antirestriction protein ArdA [Asticcacaulis sp. YBE204]|uniref:antirestriction protein ArdA n=1 Tax=Asticcacaulis sp. YBE204 TaxID=1282363 RepID=UPI0003C3E05C|nr:antirestriction protein ArdA [Asticcacaulis sp. YBE204]ESQ76546.1 hypothetical protein AEYBE204_19335 [Asticcacaulis sp. YBE204]
MTTLYAQPYDISAGGFYFKSKEEYSLKSKSLVNDYGQPVEEFEMQFIDGDSLDCALFAALDVHQGDIEGYFQAVEEWDDTDKIKVIIAVGEAGYRFNISKDSPDRFDVELYECVRMSDLAEQFVAEGLYGVIPETLRNYIDYEAIGRDLSMDYAQVTVDGTPYIYRCA